MLIFFMKIYAISDLHLSFAVNKPMDIFGEIWDDYLTKITTDWNTKVCDDDIVLIAGDISWAMRAKEVFPDLDFISKLNGKKIMIRGNHDYWWTTISAVRRILPKNIYAIQNDALKFGDYIFCGTRGWTVSETGVFETEHDHKIFNSEVVRLELTLSAAKKLQKNNEKIICMIHFPPMNSKKEPSEFTNLIEKYGVSKVVYGHLHKNKKSFSSPLYYIQNGVEYYLTSCDMLNFELVSIV